MSVRKGFYQHYKGPIYMVLGVGKMHDTEARVVVYESTQSCEDGEPRLRYEHDFEAWIDPHNEDTPPWRSITPPPDGYVPRFKRIEKWELRATPSVAG